MGYCIYCYTNRINGKKYIGQTKDIRRRCHPSNYKSCSKFYAAIEKYGYENFDFEILEKDLTIDEANIKEEEYIFNLNTIQNGYNIKSGGLNNIYSEESKKKMSNKCKTKQRIRCIETNKEYNSAMEIERELGYANSNIIACCLGKTHTAYGYTWEYIDKEITVDRTDKRKRKVYCVELKKVFESAAKAAEETGTYRSNITKCCQNKLNTTGGYHWNYID